LTPRRSFRALSLPAEPSAGRPCSSPKPPRIEEILLTIVSFVHTVLGADTDHGPPLGMDTYCEDLALDSIETVRVAELLRGRYGERVDFDSWTRRLDLDAILALTIGDVARFIDQCLS
jgi:acyl carrier protein